ncbi:MAG: Hsp70 family protein, partial [Myxococcales bacterium]|nr:Hsp70 family protein [Myxococcales bacterium]
MLSRIGVLPPAKARAHVRGADEETGLLLTAPSVVGLAPETDAAARDEEDEPTEVDPEQAGATAELIAGERARRLSLLRPRATATAAPRLLGRRYDELDEQPWARGLALTLTMTRGPSGDLRVLFADSRAATPKSTTRGETGDATDDDAASELELGDVEREDAAREGEEDERGDAVEADEGVDDDVGEELRDEVDEIVSEDASEDVSEDVDEALDEALDEDVDAALVRGRAEETGGNDVVHAAPDGALADARGPWAAPRLVGRLLRDLRREVEHTLFDALEEQPAEALSAVVSAPAGYDGAQRRALVDACALAGIRVRRLVHPTTAAALVYRARRVAALGELLEPETLAFVHVGHGGAEVAIIELSPDGLEVLAVRGLLDVGGMAFDERVVEWLAEGFLESSGVDADADPVVRQRMLDAASKAKVVLSEQGEVEINLPFLSADESGPRHLRVTLTQTRFEQLIDDLVARVVTATERALADARVDVDAVTRVFMFGGAARVPLLQERLELMFKREPELEL